MNERLVSVLSRNWPFANGSGRIIDKLGKGVVLGEGTRVCTTSDAFEITVFENDHIGRHIALSGAFDRSPIALLVDFCEIGDRCVDIGANIGYVACLLLQDVKDSHVFCIEPQPGIVELLEANLSRFPRQRWQLLKAALSDADGEGHLELDRMNRGASSIVTEGSAKTVKVPMLNAAEVLGKMAQIDIIKMDIEGHEETVFRSILPLLKDRQPRAILFEDKEGKSAPAGSIGKILASAGYSIFGVHKSLLATTLRPVTSQNTLDFNDFLAVSKSRVIPERAAKRHRGALSALRSA